MMAEAGPENSSHHDLNVHIKQELDNGSCCSPSPSTIQSHTSTSEKNFNSNKNCNVSDLPGNIPNLFTNTHPPPYSSSPD